jgi:hypothetical protein
VLSKDVPFVLEKLDQMLTKGLLGRFFRYICSDRTPIIMVNPSSSPCCFQSDRADNVPYPYGWRDVSLFQYDVE